MISVYVYCLEKNSDTVHRIIYIYGNPASVASAFLFPHLAVCQVFSELFSSLLNNNN